ncbi:cobalamin-binding protein [Uliginosibacterium paludis]|uniref:Cobalamin-binding protein n=1 Tax=Uliginosibacterium paludis TaxID=1615952 RepID=A0ABV2CW41_9RHOO
MSGAQRIVCLTEETTETLYLLGEEARIVGISGYTVRPERARKEKPRVSAFTSAKIDRILELEPDLVIGFSDLQADIASQLIRSGINVLITNQRSVEEILQTVFTIGALAGVPEKAAALVAELRAGIDRVAAEAATLPRHPRVYFEEWNEPLISGIRWVAELIVLAGGEESFPELKQHKSAKQRIIADPLEVVRRAPDILIASWCGKKFQPEQVLARAGWATVAAVRDGELYEIKSCDILQPGPAALTDGLRQLAAIIRNWAERRA